MKMSRERDAGGPIVRGLSAAGFRLDETTVLSAALLTVSDAEAWTPPPLAELTEEALIQILIEPKNALIKQYSKLLEMEGAELEIRPAALHAIAKKALARKTGARGLRSILEHALLDVMYELPSQQNVVKVVIDENTITNGAKPLLIYSESAKASGEN